MPNLKDIRRRIGSVKKTQQITSAMRMVAAAKLRRAQDAIEAARPYAETMRRTLSEVAASQGDAEHPLLTPHEKIRNLEFVVITSDRGLCGAFNGNVLKRAEAEITARRGGADAISLTAVGGKARDYFMRHKKGEISKSLTELAHVDYSHAVSLADHVAARYEAGEVDEVILVHSEFVSTMTQRPRCVRLLPLVAASDDEGDGESTGAIPYEIEPSAEQLLKVLVPKALQVELFRALLDNQAGEHAARMTAMESATRNTEEMIERLTLQYNRARQAAITKELVEIVSGAEAM